MILLIEPISKNVGMLVPTFPLPLLEIASYAKGRHPDTAVEVVSVPMDYGVPLTADGRDRIYASLLEDIAGKHPKGVGISCTAIAQAEESIRLADRIKARFPGIFVFLGGYFPTIYHEEIFSRTGSVDAVVAGEGEIPLAGIIESLAGGRDPRQAGVPSLIWIENGKIRGSSPAPRFDLRKKRPLDLDLLRRPDAYDLLPYAFSRGCPFGCRFCMEDNIRPTRRSVPESLLRKDLTALRERSRTDRLLACDALFRSYDRMALLRSLGMTLHFETRCDLLDPRRIPEMADVCGMLALGLESASYSTLRRMNKVKDRAHFERYIANAEAIFSAAVRCNIPVTVFWIAGYPGDTAEDMAENLRFARRLSSEQGPGGYVFKIGECRVYPRTKLSSWVRGLADVVFDDDGVFGQNVVRRPSAGVGFEDVVRHMKQVFELSRPTDRLQQNLLRIMPFFRLPGEALRHEAVPQACFADTGRHILKIDRQSLSLFRPRVPQLNRIFHNAMSDPRKSRELDL